MAPGEESFPHQTGFCGRGGVWARAPVHSPHPNRPRDSYSKGGWLSSVRMLRGGGTRAKPRAVFSAPSTPVQARRPPPVHCCGGVRAASVPCGILPAPLLLLASERVGQATCGTHVGCRAAFLVVFLFFSLTLPPFFSLLFSGCHFCCLCCCAIEGVLYTCRDERREKSRGELPLPLGSYCFKAQRQSSLDEDFEKTRTYTYIINMYTCRHFCVVARIYI